MALEGHFFGVVNHIGHPVDAEDIGDFVRVGDGGHCSVYNGHPGEFRWDEHRTFNMYMRVDEAGNDEMRIGGCDLDNAGDHAVFDSNFSRKYVLVGDIYDLASDGHDSEFIVKSTPNDTVFP